MQHLAPKQSPTPLAGLRARTTNLRRRTGDNPQTAPAYADAASITNLQSGNSARNSPRVNSHPQRVVHSFGGNSATPAHSGIARRQDSELSLLGWARKNR